MGWSKPKHSRGAIDKAGATIRIGFLEFDPNLSPYHEAQQVVANWRSAHAFPLNTLQNCLRRMAKQVDSKSTVAQRLKRLRSIRSKLERQPNMQLSQMQDIGGCRAVVTTVEGVKEVRDLFQRSQIKHKHSKEFDYISHPKESGYRGIHLVYKYHSDKNTTYNGLRIEIQIRSLLQHAWATAVETAGTFTRQALKSSQGERDWLQFFRIMGTVLALKEDCPVVPNTPTGEPVLKAELTKFVDKLDVVTVLSAYQATLRVLDQPQHAARFYLIQLNPSRRTVKISAFNVDERAHAEYLAAEQKLEEGEDAVLVSAESVSELKRAYPNYFGDTHLFISFIQEAMGRAPLPFVTW